jgi:hypothetical protein
MNTYYNYSYAQEIYPAADLCLNAGDVITEVSFQYIHTSCTVDKNIVLYLGNTTKSTFSSTSDWVPVAQMQLSFDGIMQLIPGQPDNWVKITLQTPFTYTGGNIVVAMDNNTGSYTCTGSSATFTYHTATGNVTLHYYSDSTNPTPSSPPSGNTTTSRNNIKFSAYCPPLNKDMAALTITGNCSPVSNAPYIYTVAITNNGVASESVYDVKVLTSNNEVLGVASAVPAIAPKQTLQVSVPVNFPLSGEVCIKGRVELPGDEFLPNNSTPLPYTCLYVRPTSNNEIIDIPCDPWVGTQQVQIPYNFYYNTSMVQSVYLNTEMGIPGGFIKSLSWFYQSAATSDVTKPVKVWLANSNINSVASGWYGKDNFTLVYEGEVTVPPGAPYQLTVSLVNADHPEGFLYTGGSLVVMTERVMNAPYINNVNSLVTAVAPAGRTREYHDDNASFNWSQPGTALSVISNLEMQVLRVPFGVVKGKVTECVGGAPMEGVLIELNKYGLTTVTDVNGEYFFPYVPAEDGYILTATKFTYHDVIYNFNLHEGDEHIYNFCMDLRGRYVVFGVVQGSDESYIEGAKVVLEGYDHYEMLTGPYGQFSFEDVLWSADYHLTVTAQGWSKHESTWDVFGHVNLGTIILYDVPYPPENVHAEELSDNLAHIYWDEPVPAVAKTYIYDDETAENGWGINAGYDLYIGGKFPVGESGVLTSVDLYSWYNSSGGTSRILTVEIFDENMQSVGLSDPFTFNDNPTQWVNIPLNDIPYSGTFYAMVHWPISGSGVTNWLGVDEDGPNAYSNLDYVIDETGSFQILHQYWSTSGANPCVVMVRANAMSSGKSAITYNNMTPVNEEGNIPATANLSCQKALAESATVEVVTAPAQRAIPPGITGYKLWRLQPGQEEDETSWLVLTNAPVPSLDYNDNSWASAAPGDYRWAVKTCYNMGIISTPAFSEETLTKYAKTTFTINLTTSNGSSPAGAKVTLKGDFDYEDIAELNSVIFQDVVLGEYDLKVTLAGYKDFTAKIEILAPGSYLVTLISVITDPYDVTVNIDCKTATLKWSHETDAQNPSTFTVFLDDVAVATGITAKEYKFVEELAIGKHTAGVQAVYAVGNSQDVYASFVIDCEGISDYDNDYLIYPNPADNFIYIERGSDVLATIGIYNALGMHINSYETGERLFKINVADLAVGTYFIRIIEGTKSTVKSFVKKND